MANRAPDTIVKTSVLALCAGIFAVGYSPRTYAQDRQAARRAAIEARLKPVRTSEKKLAIAPGDTQFLEVKFKVPSVRVQRQPLDYEGLVSGIVSPEGVVVHQRVHEFELLPAGSETEIRFLYAIHVEPGTIAGGQVRLTVSLVERIGLANTVAKKSIAHQLRLSKSNPTPRQIAADFYGYRYYRRLALRRRKALQPAGLRLSIKDQDRLPPLDRAPRQVTEQVFKYDRERRLMWVAQRHLVAAMQHPDAQTRTIAQAYLRNLDLPRRQWDGVPSISLIDRAVPPPPAAAPVDPGPSDSTAVARIEPTSERPLEASPPPPDPDRAERLQPSIEYEVDTERLPPPPPPPPPPAPPEPPPKRTTTVAKDDPNVVYEDDPFGDQPIRKITRIPSYVRGLVLEDANIGFGAAVRTSYASIETRESANTLSIFYSGQAALTRYLGLELIVPTQYLDITSFPGDRNPPAQYEIGNPLLALKYRLQLPKIQGRRPAVTIKARWGIPIAPLHGVPATELIVEEFTREVNFPDTYAFFLENHDFGLGANFVWQWRWLYTGLQLFGDVFVPVGGASQDATFSAISYGASVGALPFGDWLGFYVEGRGTSLLLGGGRNEFFTYIGARGRFIDRLEPAIWVGLPLGSVREVSPVQVGIELRFSYDVDDVLAPRRQRRQQDLLE